MCRFLLYVGPPISLAECVINPEHSLVHQSVMSLEGKEPFNGDGFGLAWFVPRFGEMPALFKSVNPAWNDRNLHHVARVSESECILAHVRAASAGSWVMRANCHPFVARKYAFMHNGCVHGFDRFRQRLLCGLSPEAFASIVGTTDSEHMFAYFLDALDRQGEGGDLDQMVGALEATLVFGARMHREVGASAPASMNFAVADGSRAVVSRYITDDPESARSLHVKKSAEGEERWVLIASEPLDSDPGWDPVPPNHFVTVDADRVPRLVPIELDP